MEPIASRTKPMISTMIPIVHRMGILMRNPTMSRMTPRAS